MLVCLTFLGSSLQGYLKKDSFKVYEHIKPFNARCPLKDHIYLNKPASESCRFV